MVKDWVSSFTAIFVAMDVMGTLPVYFQLTERMTEPERRKVVNFSILVALATAMVFAFLGQAVFQFLGIDVADFRVAGGLVLLLISLADLVGKPEHESRITGSSGVVPLAVGSALKRLTGSNATLRIGMRPSVLVRRGIGCGTSSFSGRSYFLLHGCGPRDADVPCRRRTSR